MVFSTITNHKESRGREQVSYTVYRVDACYVYTVLVHTFNAHILIEHGHVLHRFGVAHELGATVCFSVGLVLPARE